MPFRPSAVAYAAKKPSSMVWLSRQARDPYVRLRAAPDPSIALATSGSYRSRSAFKLLEMDEKWNFLANRDVNVVLDLGAAPGGWSQVVSQKLGWETLSWSTVRPGPSKGNADDGVYNPLDISDAIIPPKGRGTIVAVDLLPMVPLAGVQFLQTDFMAPDTETRIRDLIVARQPGSEGKADVILCDMASNSTGNAFHDIESSLAICTSVFEFSKRHIRSARSVGRDLGGVLLMKHFVHPLLHIFRKEQLEKHFSDVRYLKPKASRTESKEGYFLCRGWKG